jgi:large subunit ribosomal protein L46
VQVYTFFYKGHIMAGQVKPDKTDVLDFAWHTKQELEGKLSPESWNAVKDMLSDF